MRNDDALRYVAARRVRTKGIDAGVPVETAAGIRLGQLEGFVVDADAHCLRYVVVEADGALAGHRLLLPFVPARVEDGRLRLLSRDVRVEQCAECDPSDYRAL